MNKQFDELKHQVETLTARLRPKLVELSVARNTHFNKPTPQTELELDAVQEEVAKLHGEISDLIARMPAASGLPLEMFEQSTDQTPRQERRSHRPRANLTAELVDATADIDDVLPRALDMVESLLPSGWLSSQPRELSRIGSLIEHDAFLSMTKGIRLESELPRAHRLRQALHVSRDYVEGNHLFDHFAGGMLIPSMVRLASQGSKLKDVGGDRDDRIRHLWNGPSADVDATIYELLTAAACVEMGRGVDFLPATDKKSPDLRCHDPYPLVIECKRQAVISDYEAAEEACTRSLFLALRKSARQKGLCGTFELTLSTEASEIDVADVVAKLISQRLAPHPERPLAYAWGEVAFRPLPLTANLPDVTRVYSPQMLEFLFDWSTDLPRWDGICCSVHADGEPLIDTARYPIALTWRNVASNALRKRTWAPNALFNKGSLQIPPGEFGIVYVSYTEGARGEVADLRLRAFEDRLAQFEHSSRIRMPLATLSRLYPRSLNNGQPDLIESGLRYLSELCGDKELADLFPTTIYTLPGVD